MVYNCFTDSEFAFKTIAVGQDPTVARQRKLISNKSHAITPFASLLFDVRAPLMLCNIADKSNLSSKFESSCLFHEITSTIFVQGGFVFFYEKFKIMYCYLVFTVYGYLSL